MIVCHLDGKNSEESRLATQIAKSKYAAISGDCIWNCGLPGREANKDKREGGREEGRRKGKRRLKKFAARILHWTLDPTANSCRCSFAPSEFQVASSRFEVRSVARTRQRGRTFACFIKDYRTRKGKLIIKTFVLRTLSLSCAKCSTKGKMRV